MAPRAAPRHRPRRPRAGHSRGRLAGRGRQRPGRARAARLHPVALARRPIRRPGAHAGAHESGWCADGTTSRALDALDAATRVPPAAGRHADERGTERVSVPVSRPCERRRPADEVRRRGGARARRGADLGSSSSILLARARARPGDETVARGRRRLRSHPRRSPLRERPLPRRRGARDRLRRLWLGLPPL